MYLLIALTLNGNTRNEAVAQHKKTLVKHLKGIGYHYSKLHRCWICGDDEECDYTIEEIEVMK